MRPYTYLSNQHIIQLFKHNMTQNNPSQSQGFQPFPIHPDQNSNASNLTHNFNSNSNREFAPSKTIQQAIDPSGLKHIYTPKEPPKKDYTLNATQILENTPFDFVTFCTNKYGSSSARSGSQEYGWSGDGSSGEKEEKSAQPNNGAIGDIFRELRKQGEHQGQEVVSLGTWTTPSKLKRVFNGRKPCNCKESKCLKMYCDCFKFGLTCEDCNCTGCHNLEQNAEERAIAMMTIKKRNPAAFTNQMRTCNCRSSQCRRDYCECFHAQMKCGENCSCLNCENTLSTTRTVRRQGQGLRL